MKQFLTVSMLVLALSACVTIESPDNLISDTIKAGKDVYKDIKGRKEEDAVDESAIGNAEADSELDHQTQTITIEHFETILEGQSDLEAMNECMKYVEQNAKATFGNREFRSKDKTYINTVIDGKATIICGATFII